MGSTEHEAEMTLLAEVLRTHRLDPTSEPPARARRLVFSIGPAVTRMMELVAYEPEALRWMAAVLAFWSSKAAAFADRADAAITEAADELAEAITRGDGQA